MSEHDAIGVLTNQRVSFSLAGKTYSARRATLNDIGRMNRYRKEKEDAGDTANLELDVELYILSELMKPNFTFTPEQLGECFDLTQYTDITQPIQELGEILGKLGFKMPQLPATPKKAR